MIKEKEMNQDEMMKLVFGEDWKTDFEGMNMPTSEAKVAETEQKIGMKNYKSRVLEDGSNELNINVVGIDPQNIEIKVIDGVLSIQSCQPIEESNYFAENVELEFNLGDTLDGTKIKAKHEFGLLTLTIPLKEIKKPKVTKIEIK
jgi:HSP20 family molecular chaperone IbpA